MRIVSLLKETYAEWREDDALQWGAALAFYTVFSLAPMLLIGIYVAGLVFGSESVQARVLGEAEALIGPAGATLVGQMLENAGQREEGAWAAAAGAGALLVGATTAFAQLKVALNRIWDVRSRIKGWRAFVRKRLLAFGLVLVVGFLLLVTLLASAALAALDDWLVTISARLAVLLRIASIILSFAVVTVLFALIFRYLPDVTVAWTDVWWGAIATALLFTVGKHAIGLYLGNASVASSYGAAGSLVVILLWVYFASQILLFGAEFTQVYARRHGSRMLPSDKATRIA